MEMQGWIDASYFQPPAIHAAAPSWVLLNKQGSLTNCGDDNTTTAYAITSAGRTIKVTFCLLAPPSVSHLHVHYPDSSQLEYFDSANAEVASSAKDLVLLRCSTWGEPHHVDYLIYHAAAGKPSLRAIPIPPMPSTRDGVTSSCFAILPCLVHGDEDDGGGEFLLAYLTAAVEYPAVAYDLRVFSSKTWAWSTRALAPPAGVRVRFDDMPHRFDKVIALGGSVLGWADLNSGGGIIACDVLDENPAAHTRFIPLPKSDFYKRPDRSSLPAHRDVACYRDGFIVLVDLDLRFRYVAVDREDEKMPVIRTIRDLDNADDILDSELIHDEYDVHVVHIPDGWKIRTCYRHISWDYWRKGHVVDVDDVTVYDPRHRAMLSELWDGGAGRWTLGKLEAKRPILSMQGGDVVYLTVVSKKGHNGRLSRHPETLNQTLRIGIDLGKKTVEMLEHVQPFIFSQHVNAPPPHQNMWNIDGSYHGSSYGYSYSDAVHHAGYDYDIYQHPPLWSPACHNLGSGLNSLGSGCVCPVNAQSTYPVPMVNTDTHRQQYLSPPPMSLGPEPALELLAPFTQPW